MTLDQGAIVAEARAVELLALDHALERLAVLDARKVASSSCASSAG